MKKIKFKKRWMFILIAVFLVGLAIWLVSCSGLFWKEKPQDTPLPVPTVTTDLGFTNFSEFSSGEVVKEEFNRETGEGIYTLKPDEVEAFSTALIGGNYTVSDEYDLEEPVYTVYLYNSSGKTEAKMYIDDGAWLFTEDGKHVEACDLDPIIQFAINSIDLQEEGLQ